MTRTTIKLLSGIAASKLLVLTLTLALACAAQAQNVAGVFGPNVSAGDRTFEYRAALAPVDGTGGDNFVHRLHYQHALNDRWRLRGVLQGSDTRADDFEFNFFQGEIQWQFLERTPAGVSSALRLDLRITERDDGADRVGLNWTTQWDINDAWQARGVILLARELGTGQRNGIFLETRAGVSRKIGTNVRLGLESFNIYGNTAQGFGSFDDQNHQFGPVFSGQLDGGWSWLAGALFGLSASAPDEDFRLWISRRF